MGLKFGEKNVGGIDKAVRVIVGLALLYAVFANMLTEPWNYFGALVALAMFATAAMGSCTLYSLLGVNTCAVKKK